MQNATAGLIKIKPLSRLTFRLHFGRASSVAMANCLQTKLRLESGLAACNVKKSKAFANIGWSFFVFLLETMHNLNDGHLKVVFCRFCNVNGTYHANTCVFSCATTINDAIWTFELCLEWTRLVFRSLSDELKVRLGSLSHARLEALAANGRTF